MLSAAAVRPIQRTWAFVSIMTLLLVTTAVIGPVPDSGAAPQPTGWRLAGETRYDTATAISQYGFGGGADVIYLARGDDFADALAAGALSGGPVLLAPPTGDLPASVLAEVRRLRGAPVIGLGGTAALPEAVLDSVAQGRDTFRLAGTDRYATAVAVSQYGFADGADVVYLSRGDQFADALAAGALPDGPILLVPSAGTVPQVVRQEVARLAPELVIALGGTAAVSDQTLAHAAQGRRTFRLAGPDRYATAVAISQYGFADGADVVYLSRGDQFADALAAGALTGGPILLVPPDGTVPDPVVTELERLQPESIAALGGPSAVPQATLTRVSGRPVLPDPAAGGPGEPEQAVGAGDQPVEGEAITDTPPEIPPGVIDPSKFTAPPPATSEPSRTLANHADSEANLPYWQATETISQQTMPPQVGRLYMGTTDIFGGFEVLNACTATVIGRDHILTAAHCVFEYGHPSLGGSVWPQFLFRPGMYGAQVPYGEWQSGSATQPATVSYHVEGYVQQTNMALDYAIVTLAPDAYGRHVGDVVGTMSVWLNGDQFVENRFSIGYPAEGYYAAEHAAHSPKARCSNDFCEPQFCWSPPGETHPWDVDGAGYFATIGFGCWINGGWSGAPIFQYSNGLLYLISVVSTGGNFVRYPCITTITGECRWIANNTWGPVFRWHEYTTVLNATQ